MADKITLRRILKLFAISAKMDLAWLLRDTKYALILIASDLIQNIGMIAGMFLIASQFGGIGGMSTNEVLFMMAYSSMTTGIILMSCAGNNIHVSRLIGRGQLEHLFIQPLPLKWQLLTSGFSPFTGSGSLITGIVLMVIAVGRLHLAVTLWWVLALLAYLLTTLVIVVARAYLFSSMTFYAPVAAEEITSTVVDGTWFMSTFPLSGMPKYIQFPLLTIMPDGLMAWFPAMCLLGKPPLHLTVYYPMFFALILSLIAGYLFKKGMNYYVTKGSNRYVPWGFRR